MLLSGQSRMYGRVCVWTCVRMSIIDDYVNELMIFICFCETVNLYVSFLMFALADLVLQR
uniref:Uncharacterized protein n=1 Tax=Arion vulgaris TaxID=1028688 RepID=A0A0B6Y0U2_9EUPU